ncbi:hypothetical protein APE_0155.1 [Aeropyrum pernix K1]|uniref:Uncharacterized protein n=1 Tax=Aeropyrum pernix (strain ATCC 700893 / DSM 11879 / JCM 9820 / NBRC 100138 / K1) TaxID=272557 RepID=Q9YFU5_AERPE|nr:hypothetical protein [Aeropyrum pernix]BAA79066.2 hypothetical protein APE_0155.1 [Aeropyrum pernix K1]
MAAKCSLLYKASLVGLAVSDIVVTALLVTLTYYLGPGSGLLVAGSIFVATLVGLWVVYRDMADMSRAVSMIEEGRDGVSCYRLGEALLWWEGERLLCYSPPYKRFTRARLDEVIDTRDPGLSGPGFVCAAPLQIEDVEFREDGTGYKVRGVVAVLTPEGKIAVGRGELEYVGEAFN